MSNLTRHGYSTTRISAAEGSESMKGLTRDVITETVEYEVVHGKSSTSGNDGQNDEKTIEDFQSGVAGRTHRHCATMTSHGTPGFQGRQTLT